MSFARKTLKGFAGLSAVSVVPLTSAIAQHRKLKIPLVNSDIGGGIKVAKEEKQGQEELLKQMIEILDENKGPVERGQQSQEVKEKSLNKKGYFPLKDVKQHELFVLIDLDNLNKSFLFHYDWSLRKPEEKKERLKQVVSIVYKSFREANLELKGSSSKKLRFPPTWMNEWKDTALNFEQNCKFQKKDESVYTLICSNPSKSTGEHSWTQEILTKDITFPSKI